MPGATAAPAIWRQGDPERAPLCLAWPSPFGPLASCFSECVSGPADAPCPLPFWPGSACFSGEDESLADATSAWLRARPAAAAAV